MPTLRHPSRLADAGPDADRRERLQKVLAAAGLGSRRACETLIEEGRVEVDAQVVMRMGTKVDPLRQEIRVDGEALAKRRHVYYAVHKPKGVVSTSSDPEGRPRVIDLVPERLGRLFNVGRLDRASEGLILLTNDGELANQLTHPRFGIEKTYHVEVAGHADRVILAKLRRGVRLAEGFAKVVHVRIKRRRKQSTVLEMVLDEGRNREIRRLLARVEHKVLRLTRVAVGPVRLGDLPPGSYRELTRTELKALRHAVQASRNAS
ncbi:MAG: pseudouridine synthase [Pirellulales bacterium]